MLAAHLKGVRKGTLIDDSVRPEENYIRRRFLSDECAAFTLLFRFENRRAREASERERAPCSTGQYIPRGFYFHRQNRRSPKRK